MPPDKENNSETFFNNAVTEIKGFEVMNPHVAFLIEYKRSTSRDDIFNVACPIVVNFAPRHYIA